MAKKDTRRYRRIGLNLPVQISVNTVDEYEGRLVNMSPGDLAVVADTRAIVGDAVVLRIKGLDVIEGTVARMLPDGFAVSFLLSKRRRAQITEQLMLRANAMYNHGLEDRRGAPRHNPKPARTVCRLADGAALYVKLLENSVDGVSLEASRRPPIGSHIHVGRKTGVVIRHTPRGFVVVYENRDSAQKPALRAV